ncbi:phenylpyruvate tautomerase PptA (4-oxalocrotonate tautomerase family) [Mycobacterium sp. OAS707]|uniref:tautomerase family protein n=1 Tax=unclassified Mycobacterium TaxID=2642494 RepID=UPI00178A6995|nr:tautomerase family protein [Mycobacterium sp. OAS707]MBE1552351.1 phenylpyruvate tautomerase PptA (4-oxalocrotonate tautomerase family) [Mycobacterium sp. OAS707]
MPMIGLTVPAGVLSAEKRRDLQKTLAATLLKWEGAPETAFFRAQAWSRVDEVTPGAFAALEDDAPRFRVDVTVPQGALSDRRKEGLVKEATANVLDAAGLSEADALRVWVLVHEQPEGTWGAGGAIVRFAELAALAKAERENA